MNIEIMRREIARAMSGVRQAYRGTLASYLHRTRGAMLASGEGLAGERLPQIEIIQQAGVASGLPPGTEMVVLPLGGRTGHSIVIATDYGVYRVDVAPGEMALHHLTEPDCHVHLKNGRVASIRGRRIELVADEEIVHQAPLTRITGESTTDGKATFGSDTETTGNAAVGGEMQAAGGVFSSGTAFDTHRHEVDGTESSTPL